MNILRNSLQGVKLSGFKVNFLCIVCAMSLENTTEKDIREQRTVLRLFYGRIMNVYGSFERIEN